MTSVCYAVLCDFLPYLRGRVLQVYQLSIGAACGLSWPSDRIVIQVLDDSTDPVIKVKFNSHASKVQTQPIMHRS